MLFRSIQFDIEEQLFEDWSNSNADEGPEYAEWRFMEFAPDDIKKQYEEWQYPYPTATPIIGDSTDMTTTYPNRPWNNPFSYGAGPVDTITLTSNINDYKITLGD